MSRSDPLRVDDCLDHIVEAVDSIAEYLKYDVDRRDYSVKTPRPHCGGSVNSYGSRATPCGGVDPKRAWDRKLT